MTPSHNISMTVDDQVPGIPHTPGVERPKGIARLRHQLNYGQILRWSGGIILSAAAIAFMYQGVYTFSPMARHWIMMGVVLLFGLFGTVTGKFLKEEKGTRLFLGLAAASFPVLSSQLGGMFFSIFGSPPIGMPQPLVFSPANSASLLITTGLTLAVIVPVSYLAFRILARSQARTLTWVYTLTNLCMLIPLRVDFLATAIIILAAGIITRVDHMELSKDFRMDSFEGRASRLMLAGPVVVMIGRSLFYPMNLTYYGFMLLLSGVYLTFQWGRVVRNNWLRWSNRLAGLAAMVAGWLFCCVQILDSYEILEAARIYLSWLPLAMVLGGHSFILTGNAAKFQRIIAAIIALASAFLVHATQATIPASVIAIGAAASIFALGTLVAEKPLLYISGLTAMIGLGNLGIHAFQMHTGYAWLILAIIGICILFCASLFETNRLGQFFKHNAMWGMFRQSAN